VCARIRSRREVIGFSLPVAVWAVFGMVEADRMVSRRRARAHVRGCALSILLSDSYFTSRARKGSPRRLQRRPIATQNTFSG
jgi:hypothetical protein